MRVLFTVPNSQINLKSRSFGILLYSLCESNYKRTLIMCSLGVLWGFFLLVHKLIYCVVLVCVFMIYFHNCYVGLLAWSDLV